MTNALAPNPVDRPALLAHHAAAAIIRRFRNLTTDTGTRVLVACSAGADSTALLLALAAHTDNLVAAYIRHDLRPRAETDLDIAFLRDLTHILGVRLVAADITLTPGNAEAAARHARYARLTHLAEQHACPFVAVAHHADDLLETQLMALIRGASPRGLASLRPRRTLSSRVTLIRPMLAITRDDAQSLCAIAGVTPIQDRTNADTARFRAALRHGILKDLTPAAARRAAQTAVLMRDAQRVIADRARDIRPDRGVWVRGDLARERRVVIIESIRNEFRRQTQGVGLDTLTGRTMSAIVRAIRDDSNETRVFALASGVRIEVGDGVVRMTRAMPRSDAR